MPASPAHAVRFVFALLLTSVLASPADAQPAEAPANGKDGGGTEAPTGLPLPRFVSLRSGEVNLRTGPGVQYPVDWVFRKKGLPLQVVAEYHAWRKVEDPEGTVGWVHQGMLTGRRTFFVTGQPGQAQPIRAKADAGAAVIARVETGVIGTLLNCPDGMAWCRVEVSGHEGWMERAAFWGALAGETVK